MVSSVQLTKTKTLDLGFIHMTEIKTVTINRSITVALIKIHVIGPITKTCKGEYILLMCSQKDRQPAVIPFLSLS